MKKHITFAQMVTRVFYSIGCMLLIAGLLLSYVTKPAFASEDEPGSEPPAAQEGSTMEGDQGGTEGSEGETGEPGGEEGSEGEPENSSDESLEPTEQEDENAAPEVEAPAETDKPAESEESSDQPPAMSDAPMMAFSSSTDPNTGIDENNLPVVVGGGAGVMDDCSHNPGICSGLNVGEGGLTEDGGTFAGLGGADIVVIKAGTGLIFFTPNGPSCSATSYCVTWNDDNSITITRYAWSSTVKDISDVTFWDFLIGDDDDTDDDDTTDDDDVADDDDTSDDDDVTDDDDTNDDDDITQDDDDVADDDDTTDDDDVADDDDTTDDDDVTQDDDDMTDDDDIVTSDDDDAPRIESDPGDPGDPGTVAAVVPTLAAPAVPVAVDSAQLIPVTGGDMTSPSFFELELNQVQDLMTHFGLIFIGAAVALQTLTKKQTK
jgi:hypothetical protein